MTKNKHLENLYDDFFRAAHDTLFVLELQYNVKGVVDQVFGEGAETEQAKVKFRESSAWATLTALYDYALFGVIGQESPDDLVIDGSDVLKLATSENYWPSREWDDIVAMGDARFALDEGEDFPMHKLALLAKVDIRTVRNAASAGNIVTYKKDDFLEGDQIYVDNASARQWLLGRKGFNPTIVNEGDERQSIKDVTTPVEFGAFLAGQRKRIGLNNDSGKLVVLHPSADPKALSMLESGVFALPLSATFPLADFYQVSRKDFLDCVMRVFFANELFMLTSDSANEGDQS